MMSPEDVCDLIADPRATQVAAFLNDPATRKMMLEEHDIKVTVGPMPLSGQEEDRVFTIQRIIDEDANYLFALILSDDHARGPSYFALPGDLIAEFSEDGDLYEGVRRYVCEKVGFESHESGRINISVFKLPDASTVELEGHVSEGKFGEF